MVLVKQFRAGIPARSTADTGSAIDNDVHWFIPYCGKKYWRYWDKGICTFFNETKRSTDRESHNNPPEATVSGFLAEQKRLPDGTKRINSSNCISDLQTRMKYGGISNSRL
jgi:hypothetical protein